MTRLRRPSSGSEKSVCTVVTDTTGTISKSSSLTLSIPPNEKIVLSGDTNKSLRLQPRERILAIK